MTAGGSVTLLGYSNQEAVWSLRTDLQTASIDSDLAVCVTLQCDLPGQAAEGNKLALEKSLSMCVDKEH